MMNITKAIFPLATASALAILSSCSTVSSPDMAAIPAANITTTSPTTARVQAKPAPKPQAKKVAKVTKKTETKQSLTMVQPAPFTQPDFLKSGSGISTEVC